jgi:DNA-binding transcriptional MerR regulator
MLTHESPKRLITTRAVGQRYGGCHPRTVKRWWQQGIIPAPTLTIRNRHYWDEAALEQHDRQLVAGRATPRRPPGKSSTP